MSPLYHQKGSGRGKYVLLIGESPSPRGWHNGFTCRNAKGDLLSSGRRLNELLLPFGLTVDECGFTELCQRVVEKRNRLMYFAEKDWPLFLKSVMGKHYKLFVLLGAHTTSIFSRLSGMPLAMGAFADVAVGGKKYAVLPIYHPSPINPKNRERNREIFRRQARRLGVFVK